MNYYDLDDLEKLCPNLEFSSERISDDSLEITILTDCILVFSNWREEKDTCIGFKNTPWHTHDKLILMTDENSYVELNEFELLEGIKKGDVLIIERFINDQLEDRWLLHKNGKINEEDNIPGEEIRIRTVSK
jgi:transcriptional regulator of heat shock response